MSSTPHDPGTRPIPYPAGVVPTAVYSAPVDCYRYALKLTWDEKLPAMMALMMNPSAAGHEGSDSTVNKVIRCAMRWGYGTLYIGNSAAYRCKDQSLLDTVQDPRGPLNDQHLAEMAGKSDFILLGYGKPKAARMQGAGLDAAMKLVAAGHGHKMHALVLNGDGTPRHPLYVRNSVEPVRWVPGGR